jgi:hypothetical protein
VGVCERGPHEGSKEKEKAERKNLPQSDREHARPGGSRGDRRDWTERPRRGVHRDNSVHAGAHTLRQHDDDGKRPLGTLRGHGTSAVETDDLHHDEQGIELAMEEKPNQRRLRKAGMRPETRGRNCGRPGQGAENLLRERRQRGGRSRHNPGSTQRPKTSTNTHPEGSC